VSGRRALALAIGVLVPSPVYAQRVSVDWGARAIPAFGTTNVVPGGRTLGEVRIVQPVAMLHAGALGGRLRLVATANFEKYTIPNGELAPGNWGESFADRRHPHTVVHELPRRDTITLNLDLRQMGVGGDDGWGARPHPEYTLDAKPYTYRFRLRPYVPAMGQLDEVARRTPEGGIR